MFENAFKQVTLANLSGTLLACIAATVLFMYIYANYVDEPTKPLSSKPGPDMPPPSEVTQLWIYPIKSCRGIRVESARLKKTGLDLDRNWMFIDKEKREFLTIRNDPSFTLVDTSLSDDRKELTIKIHGTDDAVTVPTRPTQKWFEENTKLVQVNIWGAETDAYEYGEHINSIFTDYFNKPVSLVFKGPSPRWGGANADIKLYGKQQAHHFADVMSLQVASEASLADLNAHLKEKGESELTIERFRPNIVIKGNEPWEEDRWKRVQFTNVDHSRELLWKAKLDVVAHCARCQVPNVDPDTAEKHKHEPWDTLMSFRRIDMGGKCCFPKGKVFSY